MNICKNCRHFKNESLDIYNGKCLLNPKYLPSRVDVIKGTTIAPDYQMKYAYRERETGHCGPEGKFYEYETDLKKRIWNEHGYTVTYFGSLVIIFATILILDVELIKMKK